MNIRNTIMLASTCLTVWAMHAAAPVKQIAIPGISFRTSNQSPGTIAGSIFPTLAPNQSALVYLKVSSDSSPSKLQVTIGKDTYEMSSNSQSKTQVIIFNTPTTQQKISYNRNDLPKTGSFVTLPSQHIYTWDLSNRVQAWQSSGGDAIQDLKLQQMR